MEAKLKELIEKAKQIAKDDYEKPLKKSGLLNPNFKRKWRKQTNKKGISYAYDGTPDKAFVFVYFKNRKVVVVDQNKKILKTFNY